MVSSSVRTDPQKADAVKCIGFLLFVLCSDEVVEEDVALRAMLSSFSLSSLITELPGTTVGEGEGEGELGVIDRLQVMSSELD